MSNTKTREKHEEVNDERWRKFTKSGHVTLSEKSTAQNVTKPAIRVTAGPVRAQRPQIIEEVAFTIRSLAEQVALWIIWKIGKQQKT